MYKLVNFWNLMKKTEKVDFWPDLHETSGCYENIKNDGHTIDMSNLREG